MSHIMALARKIRRTLVDTQQTIDELLSLLAVLVGVWFLAPSWLFVHAPRVAEQLSYMVPIRMWGLTFVTIGTSGLFGLLMHRPVFVVGSHLFGSGLWFFVGSVMLLRPFPLLEGPMFILVGLFAFRRAAQIPTD